MKTIKNMITGFFTQPLFEMKNQKSSTENTSISPEAEIKIYNDDDPIEILDLPIRLENALKWRNIESVGKFYKTRRKKLYKVRNLGPKSVRYLMKLKRNIMIKKTEEVLISVPQPETPVLTTDNYSFEKSAMYEDLDIPDYVSKDDPIESLGLPARLENTLKFAGDIQTIGQLFEATPRELMNLRNMGEKSVNFIMYLRSKLNLVNRRNNGSALNSENVLTVLEIPNEMLIEILLKRCDSRDREVMQLRYGLLNGEKETLEDIGKPYGITRERVRQIQKKALKKMKHPNNKAKKPIMDLVEKILWEDKGLISAEEADKIIPTVFKNVPYDGSSLLDLLSDLEWLQNHKIGDVFLYSPNIDKFKLPDFVEEVVGILKKNKDLLDAEDIIKNLSIKDKLEHSVLSALVYRCCKLDPRIEERVSGKFTPYSPHSRATIWVSLLKQVLEDEGAPMYFTEIADRVNDQLITGGQHLDHRRAHAILIETPMFAHTGIRSTYGLTKWGLRKESTLELAAEFIRNAGFPVHFKQIYHYVSKYKDSPEGNIRSRLETSGKFVNKGNGLYWIKE